MKLPEQIDAWVEEVPLLQQVGETLAGEIHQAILAGGDGTRNLADLLHGTWFGHPLHPALVTLPIGSWAAATLFDLLALTGDERAEYAADSLTALGVASAVPTVLAGLADYSAVSKSKLGSATLHALLMDVTLTLFIASLWQRVQGNRGSARLLSLLGSVVLGVGAYMGGHLSYGLKVGVDHAQADGPTAWTTVAQKDELAEGQPKRVEVDGNPILLYRHDGTIYAIGARCAHAGGPLEEGDFDGLCVTCPWHDSIFDLRDGSIVHGPTTYPQPNYRVRVQGDQVEVRLAE